MHHGNTKGSARAQPRTSHEFHVHDKTLLNLDHHDVKDQLKRQGAEDSVDMFFTWDEEDTLLSELMEEGPTLSEDDRLDALAESLQIPFDAQGKQLKKEMAKTFVPAVRQVKALHRILDESVDVSFGKGINVFNNACKDMEVIALAQFDALNEAYQLTRKNIQALTKQLQGEYSHRNQLWLGLEAKLDAIVDPVLLEIKDTPGRVERTIAKLEKHCQTMEKDSKGTAPLTEKRLKELINKLG